MDKSALAKDKVDIHPATMFGAGPEMPRREVPLSMVAMFAGVAWLIRYALKYGLHLTSRPEWAGFFDQSRYIASALALSHGDLAPASHWYPLGYSLLAAPFAWLIPEEPFFLPDLALFVATALAFTAVMRRLGVGSSATILLFLLGDMVLGRCARLWLEPWTTSLTASLIWALIAQTLKVVQPPLANRSPVARDMLFLGMLAGALPLVRPADGLIGMLAIVFAVVMLWRQHRLRIAGLAFTVIGGLALLLPYALLHLAIYGPHATDYARGAAGAGFAFSDLPWKSYVLLFTAVPWFPASPSLIEAIPWAVPGVAGLGVAWRCGDARARTALALIALLALPYSALFLAFTDLQPPGLWGFSNAHYFKWMFPLFAVGSWLWVRELGSWSGTRRALIALFIVVLPAFIRPLPLPVPDRAPARMLMFRGATDRDWDRAYFSPVTITDARGTMVNVSHFHQIPDAQGERAIAISRLFVGQAVRDDPGDAAPYRTAQKPYARYAVRLSPGIPCWLKRQAVCRTPPSN